MTPEVSAGEMPAGEVPVGRVSFVGAGPGAADLITVRGARRIAEADLVIWSASLVPAECVQEHARAGAELVDASRLGHEELVEIYRRAERERLSVARLHSGDPTLWGAVQEQYDACARMHLEAEIVPGVTGFSAAAARVGSELTSAGSAQPVMVSRMDGGKVAMPEQASIAEFARRGATMALSVSAARTGQLVEELRAGGYADDVPVVIAYKTSSPDELLLRTTLVELQATVKQHKLWRNTLFLVGRALAETGRSRRSVTAFRRADESGDAANSDAVARRRPWRAGKDRDRVPPEPGSGRWRAATVVVGSSGTGSAEYAETADGVPEPRLQDTRRPGQPDSAVAWWAVRDWQRTARGTARIAAARTSAKGVAVNSGQPALFVDDEALDDEAATQPSVGQSAPTDAAAVPAADERQAAEAEGPAAGDAPPTGQVPVEEHPDDGGTAQAPDSTGSAAEDTAVRPQQAEQRDDDGEAGHAEATGTASKSRGTGGAANGPAKSAQAKPKSTAAGTKQKSTTKKSSSSSSSKRKPAAETNGSSTAD